MVIGLGSRAKGGRRQGRASGRAQLLSASWQERQSLATRWKLARAPSRAAADCKRRCGVGLELREAVLDVERPGARAGNSGLDVARVANHPGQDLAQLRFVVGSSAAEHQLGLVRLDLPVAHDRLQPRRCGGAGDDGECAGGEQKDGWLQFRLQNLRTFLFCLRRVAGTGRRLYAFVISEPERSRSAKRAARRR